MRITKATVAKIQISARIAVLVAGIAASAAGPAFAGTAAGMEPEQAGISASDVDAANLPVKPRELLLRMKSAMEQGEPLNDDFYSSDNLAQFFGIGYRFTSVEEDDGRKTIYFDSANNVYLRDGEPTLLGRNRPCLQRGSMSFAGGGPRRKAKAGIGITTSAGDEFAGAINADLVREIFGAPSAVKEGYPSAPHLHGLPYQLPPKTNELGNLWLIYKTELDGQVLDLRFRTLGDATVMEIQISEVQR